MPLKTAAAGVGNVARRNYLPFLAVPKGRGLENYQAWGMGNTQ